MASHGHVAAARPAPPRPPRTPCTPLSTRIRHQEHELEELTRRREMKYGNLDLPDKGPAGPAEGTAQRAVGTTFTTVQSRIAALDFQLDELKKSRSSMGTPKIRRAPKIERKTISSQMTEEQLLRLYTKHASGAQYGSSRANAYNAEAANASAAERRRRVTAAADGLDLRALQALLADIHILVDLPEGPDREAAASRWLEELDIDGNGTVEWYELRRWWIAGGGAYTVNMGREQAKVAANRLGSRTSQWLPRTPTRPPRYPGLYYGGRLHLPIGDHPEGEYTPAQLFTEEQLARRPWLPHSAVMHAAAATRHQATIARRPTSTAVQRRTLPTRDWHQPASNLAQERKANGCAPRPTSRIAGGRQRPRSAEQTSTSHAHHAAPAAATRPQSALVRPAPKLFDKAAEEKEGTLNLWEGDGKV